MGNHLYMRVRKVERFGTFGAMLAKHGVESFLPNLMNADVERGVNMYRQMIPEKHLVDGAEKGAVALWLTVC